MICKKCGGALTPQDSKRYPYTCTKCGIAYGAWIAAPRDEYTDRAHQWVSDRMFAMKAHDERRAKVIYDGN